MFSKIKTARSVLLIVGVTVGIAVTDNLVDQAQAEEGTQAVSAA